MINIAIYIESTEHGRRKWPSVPRIGDMVIVTVKGEIKQLVVRNVIWGITEASRTGLHGQCEVAVVCWPEVPHE